MLLENAALTVATYIYFKRWPPLESAIVFCESADGTQIALMAKMNCSLGLTFTSNDTPEHYDTTILLTSGGLEGLFLIQYLPGTPRLSINGINIPLSTVGRFPSPVTCLPGSRIHRNLVRKRELNSHIPHKASNAEALFVRELAELNAATESVDWYTILKSSATLRLLLLDGLLDKANQRFRIKLKFTVTKPRDWKSIYVHKVWTSLLPLGETTDDAVSLDLSNFLKFVVFYSPSTCLTVWDIINTMANSAGGVHLGPPKPGKEVLLTQLDQHSVIFDQPASRAILRQICIIVVRGCLPLLQQIQSSSHDAA